MSVRLPSPLSIAGALCLVGFATVIGGFAGPNLGYDFDAYRAAAVRLLAGRPLYDLTADVVGPAGLFLYPPPVAVAFVPFALVPEPYATYVWCAAMAVVTVVAIALMPVGVRVRELLLLAAAWSLPVQQAIKLGQVEPILVLLFTLGWRAVRQPSAVGIVAAVGTLIKLRPGLLFVWALVTGERRAVWAGVVVLVAVVTATSAITGLTAWTDYLRLLGQVSDTTTAMYAVNPGAAAYQLGATTELAALVQLVFAVLVAIVWVAGLRAASTEAGFITTLVASQALSPIIWDHSGSILLLPAAFLLQRRAWWSILLVAAPSIVFVTRIPPALYPSLLLVALVAVPLLDRRTRR